MLDMESQKPEFKWYKCKEDDILPEKLLIIKLAKLGELEWR